MKSILILLGVQFTRALFEEQRPFCCYGDVESLLPADSIEVLIPGSETKCTHFKPKTKEACFNMKALKCKKYDPKLTSQQKEDFSVVSGLKSPIGFFEHYQSYENMKKQLKLWSNTYLEGSFIDSIGKTHEERDIFSFKVSSNNDKTKKSIWINGGLHGNEWISPAAINYIIFELLNNVNTPQVKELLQNFDFYFTPLSNPDGYEYSRTNLCEFNWQKNRRANKDGSYGIDLDFYWDAQWDAGLIIDDGNKQLEEKYEPEVLALKKFVNSMPNKYASLDVHSYGQKIIRTWGEFSDPPEISKKLRTLASSMIETFSEQGYSFTYNNTKLLPEYGALNDWLSSKAGFISLIVDLPPKLDNPKSDTELLEVLEAEEKNTVNTAKAFYKAFITFANKLKKPKHYVCKAR